MFSDTSTIVLIVGGLAAALYYVLFHRAHRQAYNQREEALRLSTQQSLESLNEEVKEAHMANRDTASLFDDRIRVLTEESEMRHEDNTATIQRLETRGEELVRENDLLRSMVEEMRNELADGLDQSGNDERFVAIESTVSNLQSLTSVADRVDKLESLRKSDLKSFASAEHVDSVVKQVEELATQPDDHSRIESVESQLERLSSSVQGVDDRVGEVSSQVGWFEDRVGGIESWVSNVEGQVGDSVQGIHDRVDQVHARVGGVEDRTGAIETWVGSVEGQVSELAKNSTQENGFDTERFDEVERQVIEIASRPEDHSRIESVEGQIRQIGDNVNEVNDRFDQMTSQVGGLEGRVGGIETWVGNVEGQVNDLAKNSTQENGFDAERFDEVERQVMEIASRPEDHSRIESVEGQIKQIGDNVNEVNDRFDQMTSQVGGLEGRVGGIETWVGNVEGQVNDLAKNTTQENGFDAERFDEVERQVMEIASRPEDHSRIESVEGQIKQVGDSVQGIHDRVDQVHARVGGVEDRAGGIETWVGSVEGQVSELAKNSTQENGFDAERFDEVERQVMEIASRPEDHSRIESVEGQIKQVGESVQGVHDRVDQVNARVGGVEDRAGGIEAWVGNIEGQVGEMAKNVTQESGFDAERFDEVERHVMEIASRPEDHSRIESLESQLKQVGDDVQAVGDRVDEMGTNVGGFEDRVGGIETRVDHAEARVSEVADSAVQSANQVEGIEQRLAAVQESGIDTERFEEVERQVMEVASRPEDNSRIESVEGQLKQVGESVQGVGDRVDQMSTQVGDCEIRVGGVETWVSNVEARVSNVEARVSEVADSAVQSADQLQGLEQRLAAVQESEIDVERFDEVERQVMEIASRPGDDTRIESVEDQIKLVGASVQGVGDRVDQVSGQVGDFEARVTGIETQVGNVEGQVGELSDNAIQADLVYSIEQRMAAVQNNGFDSERFDEVERQVMEIATRPDNDGRIASVEESIEALRTNCAHSELIGQLENRVDTETSRLDGLTGRVDAIDVPGMVDDRMADVHAQLETHDHRLDALEAHQTESGISELMNDLSSIGEPVGGSGDLDHGPLESDDLKRIRGIGQVIENVLNERGICTFAQIAAMGVDELETLSDDLEHFRDRVQRDRWVDQARELLNAAE